MTSISSLLNSHEISRQRLTSILGKVISNKKDLLRYQRDLCAWYAERFKGDPKDIDWSLYGESYEKHKWDGTANPFKAAVDSLANWQSVGIESATSTGKTYVASIIVYWFLDVFPDSLVVTTAPKQQQLKAVLWSEISSHFHKFKAIRPEAEMFSLRLMPNGSSLFRKKNDKSEGINDEELKDQHQAIGVVSGVRADEDSATKMQGYHRKYMLFIVEECAGVPQPVMTAIKNTCTSDHNVILSIGNPDSSVDALHQFCELPHVNHITISAFDHPNIVLGKTLIHGAVTQKSIDIRRAEYGEESNLYKSRVRGIAPKQSQDALIHYDWIINCDVNSDAYKHLPVIEDDEWSFNAVGVDVANSENGDAACLAWGQNNELKQLHEFQCPNANHLAHNLVKNPDELEAGGFHDYNTSTIYDFNINPGRIGIDAVGVGAGTVNEFDHPIGYEVVPLQGKADQSAIPTDREGKPLYQFKSLRVQMYVQARIDLQNRYIRLNIPKNILKQLIKELTIIKYKLTDGYLVIDSKEEIKSKLGGKSPNLADSFVYWNWVRKDRGEPIGGLPLA